MIVVFQNHQITAVDKELLHILKCSLNDLSDKISLIDLALKSIQNGEIKIDNKIFSVKEVPLVSVESISIYQLSKKSELPMEISETSQESDFKTPSENKDIESLLGEFEIKPIETLPEENLKSEKPLEETETKPLETKEASFEISKEQITPSENLKVETEKESSKKESKESEEITITFDDEFEEIEKILSLDDEKAKKLILEDLEKAADDFEMDLESIKELYNELLSQIKTNKDNFYNAIKAHDYEKMHKIAHSLKGASLNLRISNLAMILKTIDEKSKEKISFDKLEFLVNNFYAFVEKVKNLENTSENTNKEITNTNIPPYLKELILDTIKNYLSTQNEKKLKKDLKYIEKLLNVKINSIEELQNIIKAEK